MTGKACRIMYLLIVDGSRVRSSHPLPSIEPFGVNPVTSPMNSWAPSTSTGLEGVGVHDQCDRLPVSPDSQNHKHLRDHSDF